MRPVWVPRSEWGASSSTETFIADRTKVPAEDKTEIHVHHTAAIDVDDATPNRWDYEEAVAYMRRLQWARPDLGPLPYCDNVAVAEDLDTVWIFEGRGALTLGAHTGGHNWAGYGIGVLGNFDKLDRPGAELAVEAIEWRVAQLRGQGLDNLGTVKNPNGWDAWGHRDTSTKTCPGHSLYPLLADFQLEDEMPKEPLYSWAKDAFAWAVNKGLYTDSTPETQDDILETRDFQRQIVVTYRYHKKVVKRAIAAGGVTAAVVIEEIVRRLAGG